MGGVLRPSVLFFFKATNLPAEDIEKLWKRMKIIKLKRSLRPISSINSNRFYSTGVKDMLYMGLG